MVRHIVSWNFKPEIDEDQRQVLRSQVVSSFHALKDNIPCLLEIRAHCPPLDSSNCDLVLYTEVAQLPDLKEYQDHPDHQALIPLIRNHFTDRRCCDIAD